MKEKKKKISVLYGTEDSWSSGDPLGYLLVVGKEESSMVLLNSYISSWTCQEGKALTLFTWGTISQGYVGSKES